MNLKVRVNDELELDAGVSEDLEGSDRIIHPPQVALFRRVLYYLRGKPDPSVPPKGALDEREGMAAAAVGLRWGSYLAVLADSSKPVWGEARMPGTSRICDSEMARINIEASVALAEWIDISREDRAIYERLVNRALAYLPLLKVQPRPEGFNFAALGMPEVAAKIVVSTAEAQVATVRADAEGNPSRLFSNALVNTAWRNGPIENIHSGNVRGYPLDRRRVTIAEERELLGFAIDRLMSGMDVCRNLALERPRRSWSEQVLPYGLAGSMLITPSGWTLTEATREARLPRP